MLSDCYSTLKQYYLDYIHLSFANLKFMHLHHRNLVISTLNQPRAKSHDHLFRRKGSTINLLSFGLLKEFLESFLHFQNPGRTREDQVLLTPVQAVD